MGHRANAHARMPKRSKAMRKSFFDTEAWKWIRTLLELAGIAAIILGIILGIQSIGLK